jgi:pimeloyl-ACP methyl ester carboxylesterase
MTPLVLVPGMMCDARLFGPQMAALGRRTVVHAPCTEHDDMGALASAILEAAPPRFALAGLSMGGIVAMEVLRQSPGRVERLALLDTNPRAEADEVRARREPQIARVLSGGLIEVVRDDMAPNYLADSSKAGAKGEAKGRAILDLCIDMALALGPEVFVRQSRALAGRPDQQETLAAWKGPALILTGAEDRPCPRERHDLMKRLMPQARLAVIDGAGHLPVLEKPEETTAELVRWLEE